MGKKGSSDLSFLSLLLSIALLNDCLFFLFNLFRFLHKGEMEWHEWSRKKVYIVIFALF